MYTVAVNKAGEVAGSAAFLRHSDGTLEVFSVFNAANSSVWDMNEAAGRILDQTRKSLYQLLADGPDRTGD